MGACDFGCIESGDSAREAFNNAVEQAQYYHGHGGYTGTIAEKDSFRMISVPEGEDPIEYADQLVENDDQRIDDKWGPAGCVDLKDGRYYFFGWASS
jgi:hypothetical protein